MADVKEGRGEGGWNNQHQINTKHGKYGCQVNNGTPEVCVKSVKVNNKGSLRQWRYSGVFIVNFEHWYNFKHCSGVSIVDFWKIKCHLG